MMTKRMMQIMMMINYVGDDLGSNDDGLHSQLGRFCEWAVVVVVGHPLSK